MKNNTVKSITEKHTNILLISISVSFVVLLALLLINTMQNNGLYIQARNTSLAISIVCAAAAIGTAIVSVMKKNLFLIEYIAFAVVMALCFYCVHGVGFVNARIMKYVTGIAAAAYMVVTYFYHTFAPKFMKK